ncbi:ATP-binding cassette domain-containing protein [Streptomyces sp. NPDC004111]|uniref:ATP-binding cassette domain-containing protein n=1 Tax=Streptomyces sp. NPDC004111 TaxID=3364690 RepID=UPI00367CE6BB
MEGVTVLAVPTPSSPSSPPPPGVASASNPASTSGPAPTSDPVRDSASASSASSATAAERGVTVLATGLTKSYGATPVLRGVGLAVPAGQVFALLGPNGAGKTTTVRILATLTTADSGTARVAGHDVGTREGRRAARRRISLTGQFAAVDEAQTGRENLRMTGRLAGLGRAAARARAGELLDRFSLTDAADRLVRTYSGGMRRRLDLAASLVTDPSVLFLDEPTTGLDPRSRQELWQMVRELSGRGTTVFLTTQYLEEADRLADRIALIDGGRIVAEGTAAELKSHVSGHRLDLTLASRAAHDRVAALGIATHQDPAALLVGIPTDGTAAHVRSLLDALDPDGADIASFALHTATLDDVFLALTESASPLTPPTETTHV